MKKKIIQSLMLLLVAVGVGTFVSCKDTNEDLYNEYRSQAVDAQTLQQRLNDLESTLNGRIVDLSATVAAINSCECSGNTHWTEDELKELISSYLSGDEAGESIVDILDDWFSGDGGGAGGSGLSLTEIMNIINSLGDQESITQIFETLSNIGGDLSTIYNTLNEHGSNITLLLSNQQAAEELLNSTIADLNALKEKVDAIKECDCDFSALWDAVHALETGLAAAEAKAQNAIELATSANTTANEAKLTADEAKTAAAAATTIANAATDLATQAAQAAASAAEIATAAGLTAQEAKDFAETAKQNAETALNTANNAISVATTAQTLANANKEAIDQLKNDIASIQSTLTEYGEKIGLNTENIQKNADAIAANVAKIETNAENIQKNKEAIEAMQTQITTVSEKAAEALQKAIDADAKATANATAIENLKPIVEANKEAIENLKTTTESLQTNVTNLTTQVENNTTNITNLTTTVDNLSTQVNTIQESVNDLKTTVDEHTQKIVKAECAANLATAKAYTDAEIATAKTEILAEVVSKLADYYTKEEIDNMLNNIKIDIQDNKLKISGLDSRVGTLETDLSTLESNVTESLAAIQAALDAIKQCTCDPEEIAKLQSDITDILTRLATAEGNISDNKDAIDQINKLITDVINKNIEKLTSDLAETNGTVSTLSGDVTKLTEDLGALQLVVENLNYITPEEVEAITDGLLDKILADSTEFKNRMDIIGDSIAKALTDMVDLETRVQVLESTTVKVDDYVADRDAILERISANETNIEDLQDRTTTLEEVVESLMEDLEELEDRMDVAEAALEQALEDIEDLKSDVAAVQEYLAKQVTGIIIQGTYNPAFGTLDLPFDVQSNILVAYYGKPTKDVEFPTSRTSNYVRAEEALTEKDMQMLNGIEVFERPANIPLMFEDGYAGKVYMTINPNTADLTDLELDIVNTQDAKSPITLTGVKKSTEKLKFGYTRGDNGFYEADAIVQPIDVEKVQRLSVDKAALKDAFKEIAEKRLNANLEQVAVDIYKVVKAAKLDKSGLKCSYTENGNTHSVYSNYNLAATAIEPLSLASYKDLNYQTVPGYERVNNLLNRISNKVNSEVHLFFKNLNGSGIKQKLANLEIKKIVVKDLSEDLLAKFDIEINEDFEIDGLSYHLQLDKVVDVPVKFDKELKINLKGLTIPVKIDDVAVDLSGVTVETPTVVVTGKATGTANAGAEIDPETGLPITDPETGEYVLVTELVVPVKDNDGNTIGNAVIDLDEIKVDANINASGDAGTITLNGNPVASINKDITIEDDQYITYTLHVDETFQTTINIDQWFYFGDNGTGKKTFHFEKKISMRDAVEELWGNAQEAIGSVNTMLDQLRDLVSALNNVLEQINSYEEKITSIVDSYIDRVRSYIDKINNKIVGAVNNINYRFQPFMVASDSKGIKRLSGSKNYPTKLAKEISIYPTSQTLELLVPIARKHVAVTNVFKGEASAQGGDSDCMSRLEEANSGKFNTVIDGNVRQLALHGFKAGYVYEIAYSALDFHGNIATRKYYVTVK